MNWLETTLIVLLIVAVLAMAWFVVRFLMRSPEAEGHAQEGLAALRYGMTSREKAKGFVALMATGVVGVHTITNKGEAYRDSRQHEAFEAGLTDAHMRALLSITGDVR